MSDTDQTTLAEPSWDPNQSDLFDYERDADDECVCELDDEGPGCYEHYEGNR